MYGVDFAKKCVVKEIWRDLLTMRTLLTEDSPTVLDRTSNEYVKR